MTSLNIIAGNILHSLILAIGLVYAACVVYFTRPGRTGFVDPGWKQDGFCIHNKEVPYWTSFDTCLYVDVFFSAVLALLYISWRSFPGMELSSEIVPMVIASTVGHGVAHGAMAHNLRSGAADGFGGEDVGNVPLWKSLAFCAMFWFPLLKACVPKLSSAKVAVMALIVTYGPMGFGGIPKEHRFAYVQTVVTLAFHFSQLLLDTKQKQRREYWSLPLLSALPPMLTAWNEALGCNAYFRDMGGHMLYDASIIVGFIVFYMDCYRHHVVLAPGAVVSSKVKKMQ